MGKDQNIMRIRLEQYQPGKNKISSTRMIKETFDKFLHLRLSDNKNLILDN